MKKYLRKRNYFLVGGSFVVLLFNYLTDPNGGALTVTWLAQLASPVVAVWFAYLARVALFDYLDLEELYLKAKETAIGSAVIFLAVCVVVFGLLGLFGNQAKADTVSTYIPTAAYQLLPTVVEEQKRLWPNHPKDI